MSLQLKSDASTATSASTWSLWFDLTWNGMPIEGASVNFVVKHGNLVLWGTKGLDDIALPGFAASVRRSRPGIAGRQVRRRLPPRGRHRSAPIRSGSSSRSGAGTATATATSGRSASAAKGRGATLGRVDAHSGADPRVLRRERLRPGQGGHLPDDEHGRHRGEPSRSASPTTAPALYADSGGTFTYAGGTVTSKLAGKYVDDQRHLRSDLALDERGPGGPRLRDEHRHRLHDAGSRRRRATPTPPAPATTTST